MRASPRKSNLHVPTVPENFTNHGGALDFFLRNAHIDDQLPVWLQMKTEARTSLCHRALPGRVQIR